MKSKSSFIVWLKNYDGINGQNVMQMKLKMIEIVLELLLLL